MAKSKRIHEQEMIKCKDCREFLGGHWWPEGEPQHGGECKLLLELLKLGNPKLLLIDKFYIQDSFGCTLGRRNEPLALKEKNNGSI